MDACSSDGRARACTVGLFASLRKKLAKIGAAVRGTSRLGLALALLTPAHYSDSRVSRGSQMRVSSRTVVSIAIVSSLLFISGRASQAQTSPSPSSLWPAPDLHEYTKVRS